MAVTWVSERRRREGTRVAGRVAPGGRWAWCARGSATALRPSILPRWAGRRDSSIASLVLQLRTKAASIVQRAWRRYRQRRRCVRALAVCATAGCDRSSKTPCSSSPRASSVGRGAAKSLEALLSDCGTLSSPWVSHSREFMEMLPAGTPEVRRLPVGTAPASVQSSVLRDCDWKSGVLLLSAPGDLGKSVELLSKFVPEAGGAPGAADGRPAVARQAARNQGACTAAVPPRRSCAR